ncbi:MAG: hypothetical protein OXN89_06400 [Bryobacterales bacterium]|nr:hypothetical protein [Bryobacterales bacterium]
MLERTVTRLAAVGADRAYNTRSFVWDLRRLGLTPHVARNERGGRSAIDGRTTRHPSYRQRLGKLVEEVFDWTRRSAPTASCATSAVPTTGSSSN